MKKPSPVAAHLLVFVALLGLLALTVAAAFWPLGPWSVVVALAIAAAKAALVMVFFMQLRHRSGLVSVFAIGGFFWLSILFALTYADLLTRGAPLSPGL